MALAAGLILTAGATRALAAKVDGRGRAAARCLDGICEDGRGDVRAAVGALLAGMHEAESAPGTGARSEGVRVASSDAAEAFRALAAHAASSLSPIGASVATTLRDRHGSWEGTTWSKTEGDAAARALAPDALVSLPVRPTPTTEDAALARPDVCRDGPDCDVDFQRRRCDAGSACSVGTCTVVEATVAHDSDAPRSLCLGAFDAPIDDVYRKAVTSEQRFGISGIIAPQGAYVAAIRNAVTRRNERALREGRQGPSFDVLVGVTSPAQVNNPLRVSKAGQREELGKLVASLTRDVPKGRMVTTVSAATYGGTPASFVHAKIAVADAREATAGTFNWVMTSSAKREEPYSREMMLRVTGAPAKATAQYFDYLWTYGRDHGTLVSRGAEVTGLGAPAAAAPEASATAGTTLGTPSAPKAIFTVATSGKALMSPFGSSAGDDAIFAMIDSAKHSVYLSQGYLLAYTGTTGGPLYTHVASAILRGVDVYVVTEDRKLPKEPEPLLRIGRAFLDAVDAQTSFRAAPDGPYVPVDNRPRVCAKLHLAGSRDEAGRFAPNHAKFVMADEQAYYVGSQNLYPGGLRAPWLPQTAEFGYVVDGEGAARAMVDGYWRETWRTARPAAISGSDAPRCAL